VHIYIDANARQITAFDVELMGESVRVQNDTLERLWHQVGSVIAGLRDNYNRALVRPLEHFAPFARVIAIDGAVDAAKESLEHGMRVGDTHPEHAVRVDALCDAADLLAFIDGRASAVTRMN
jgi:hypothetical protein